MANTTTIPSAATPGECMNLDDCPMYSESFIALEPSLNTISKVLPTTSFLILNEKMKLTPIQGALLLQQKLMQINNPDHILIMYSNFGHEFYPSSQWQT